MTTTIQPNLKAYKLKCEKLYLYPALETNTISINYKRTIIEEFTQMQNQQSWTRLLKFIQKKKDVEVPKVKLLGFRVILNT